MPRLSWPIGDYSSGVDHGVFYPRSGEVEVWPGLASVTENAPDLRTLVKYQDGVKVLNMQSEHSFSGTIEAYSYPVSLTSRTRFDFTYRVMTAKGYRIHLVYNARAMFSEHSYTTDETGTFSFDISTVPVSIPGVKPAAHLVIDTETAYPWTVAAFEDALYGSDASLPRMPSSQEVFDIFEENSLLRVIDNGDGTFTIDGPDAAIQMIMSDEFQVNWPSVTYLDADTYQIKSL